MTTLGHDIVAVGASAGGVEALTHLVQGLPGDFPAAVFVVLHLPATAVSVLPQILERRGRLPAVGAVDGMAIECGRVYVAPPDFHLLVKHGRVTLSRGPKENRQRPAVDPLFRSAARAYGPRVIGVVLSGALDDGTSGLRAIKLRGGVAIAQDPADALFASMPQSAIAHVPVDYVLPAAEMGAVLTGLVGGPLADPPAAAPRDLELEVAMAELGSDGAREAANGDEHPGSPSSFACPECGGTLWEIGDGDLTRFRCRIGHAYTSAGLLADQAEQLEDALWASLRSLEEQASLARRLAQRATEQGQPFAGERFLGQAADAEARATSIHRLLAAGAVAAGPPAVEPTVGK